MPGGQAAPRESIPDKCEDEDSRQIPRVENELHKYKAILVWTLSFILSRMNAFCRAWALGHIA